MSEGIIGRKQERKTLSNALQSSRSELVAIYGRRRIGKTFLIREFYKKETVFSFTGLSEGERAVQIKNFMTKLNSVTDKFTNEKPKDWLDCFALLRKHIDRLRKTKKKKVIFIDEFPWIATPKSGFLPAFENFWNDYCTTRTDLVVVICGSAASYMVKKIIKNHKGLSKRITKTINLKPFTLGETKAFLKAKGINLLDYELLKIYMSLGGVPEYLEQVNRGESAVSTIQNLCFSKNAYLEDEYENVFMSLFEQSSYHKNIINTLAVSRKKGLSRNELLNQCQIDSGGKFSKALFELEISGFILKYQSYRGKRKETLYRIYDEFCLFYLQFMLPYKGQQWQQLYQKQEYITWCGLAFETICLKHSDEIKKALNIAGVASKNYTWSNENAQVDLVIDRDDNWVNLCELKFYNKEFTIDAHYYKKLELKKQEFKTDKAKRKGIFTTLLSTYGITQNEYSSAAIDNNLTIECLFDT